MVSFRLSVVRQAGFGSSGGCSVAPRRRPAEDPLLLDSQGPPLRGGHAGSGVLPGSQPHDPGQDPARQFLTEALAPRRLAAYARASLSDECRSWLRMAEESDQLSRWMRPSCYEVQDDVSRLLQAWVVKARPDLASVAKPNPCNY